MYIFKLNNWCKQVIKCNKYGDLKNKSILIFLKKNEKITTMKLTPKLIPGSLHVQNKGSCDWYVALKFAI